MPAVAARPVFESVSSLLVRRKTLGPDEVLFSQGDVPRFVYFVRQGVLKLTRCSPCGRQVITELLFPGDACDLLSCLDGHPYTVTGSAVSHGAVEVEYMLADEFQTLAARRPEVMEEMMAGWRARLQFQREMMVSIAVERVEKRALRALAMLAERLGQPCGQEVQMVMPLTRQEFSELIGTTMESAIRTLSRFKKQSLIGEDHHTMTVPSLKVMRELCGPA